MNLFLQQPEDDPAFIALLETMTRNLLRQQCSRDLYLIQLNNWFDFKWLGFSAKLVGALGFWQHKLTLPPFHPHRVTQERYACILNCQPLEFHIEKHAPLHIKQSSEQNLQRKVSTFSTSGLFVWYASQNERACVMVYHVAAEEASGWYAQFERTASWQIKRTNKIDRKSLALLLELQ